MQYLSPLHEAAVRFPQTELWNDSCGAAEVEFAMKRGAVGATSNPVIVGRILKDEMQNWRGRIDSLLEKEIPEASDEELCWKLTEEAGKASSEMFMPMFRETKGSRGWQALQVNPRYYRSTAKTVAHARALSSLNENILIKMPVSTAAVAAIEECIYHGVSVNGTVCFGIPQAVAVAEAVERGLKRREKEGLDISSLNPSCTIMVGRINDYMTALVARDNLPVAPDSVELAGVAIMKKAYTLFRERGYRLRILGALNHSHWLWSHFLGGDLILTVNPVWWRRLEGCSVPVEDRMDQPVPETVINELLSNLPEYAKIYHEDGMTPGEFNDYGAFHRTMREFFQGYDAFLEYLRTFMLSLPDDPQ